MANHLCLILCIKNPMGAESLSHINILRALYTAITKASRDNSPVFKKLALNLYGAIPAATEFSNIWSGNGRIFLKQTLLMNSIGMLEAIHDFITICHKAAEFQGAFWNLTLLQLISRWQRWVHLRKWLLRGVDFMSIYSAEVPPQILPSLHSIPKILRFFLTQCWKADCLHLLVKNTLEIVQNM